MTLHLKFTIVKFYKIGHNSDEVDLMDFDFVKEEIDDVHLWGRDVVEGHRRVRAAIIAGLGRVELTDGPIL